MSTNPVRILNAGGFATFASEGEDDPSRLLDALRRHIAKDELAAPRLDQSRRSNQPWMIVVSMCQLSHSAIKSFTST